MNEKNGHLPDGWRRGKYCVVWKQLDSFLYAEVRFEPDEQWGHDYALYQVNVDGPKQEARKGVYNDIGKAMAAGDDL